MALAGFKTRNVFDRYQIVSEADLSEGVAKLAKRSGDWMRPRFRTEVVTDGEPDHRSPCGEMSEWLKEHDWKSCRR